MSPDLKARKGQLIEKRFLSILIGCFLTMFFSATPLLAVSLSNNLPSVLLSDLKIGSSYNLKDLIAMDITWTYTGYETDEVICSALNSGITLAAGYEAYPDTSTVTITPATFSIANNGTQDTAVNFTIPYDTSYLGKKIQLRITGQTNTGSGRAGASSTLLMDISSIYIGYGVTTYPVLSNIGLIGNKAVITTNIASTSAPTVKLYYRRKGVTAWTQKSATLSTAKGNNTTDYAFEIPASEVTAAALSTGELQYIISTQAGSTIAYSPDQTTEEFEDPAQIQFHPVTISRRTTGQISTSGSTINVVDGNPYDGEVQIVAPRGAVAQDLDVTLTQIDETSSSCPAAPSFSLSEKPAMIFNLTPNSARFLKNVDLTLLYFDLDNNGIVDGLEDRDGNATINEASLKMFWWDGFKWRLVKGVHTQDLDENTITVKTSQFAYYALFPVTSLSPEDYRPGNKIITPNGDGKNDLADFSGLAEEIKIFDITGRKIRSISAGTGEWDGKDDGGSIVESGVYIYQFKVDGTLVSGVIAVAK